MSNWQYLKKKTFWAHIGLMLVAFIVFIFLVKFFLKIYTKHGREIELADFTYKTIDEIKNEKVKLIVIDSIFNEDLPPLTIVNQYPEPGMKVKPGRKVYVTVVSKSYEKVPLPDLTDLTLRAATLQLQAYGFEIGKIEKIPSIGQTVIAIKSITEMIYQKGTTLQIDDNGLAISGVIIRHLVLPENINNSLKVLDILSDNFGINLWISLMSQYTPIKKLDLPLELQRPLKRKEYKIVVNYMQELGFHHGWVQDLESIDYLFPDFSNKSNPF